LNSISRDPAYRQLKNRLIELSGLAFYTERDNLLTELIAGRLADLGLHGCSAYAEFLANGEAGRMETDLLFSRLTIGETYFFRDEGQFAAIRDIILPEILERKRSSKRLRIWSAGCATGAEPYSLAILLADELAGGIAGWQVEIHASDLNRGYLAQAADGKFRQWALRATSDEMKENCFSNEGSIWTIHPRYKQWISFHHMNLVESEFDTSWSQGQFDLILCRNVMMYFTPEVNRGLIGRFHQSLGDGGWLLVGAVENCQEHFTAFQTVNTAGARLYQKRARPQRALLLEPMNVEPEPVASVSHQPTVEPGAADLEGLRLLADRGDWEAAAEYGHRLLARDRLNPAAHFYQALIFENLGIPAEAELSLRRAIYLDRNFALAHYHLGLTLRRDRQIDAAARCFSNVLKVLTGVVNHATVKGAPGVTVNGLKELARMHLNDSSAS
jgi:chemotaxis protein methyltransferase CheR